MSHVGQMIGFHHMTFVTYVGKMIGFHHILSHDLCHKCMASQEILVVLY